ncbi:MAG TPA: hypothetical protein PLD47_00390 [Aggregatilineales bacterium]|nr:hypothetical protein [Anaerolineales bacterium]HRE46156.1 hypothetical protein [Aggregatilineales bacterium]
MTLFLRRVACCVPLILVIGLIAVPVRAQDPPPIPDPATIPPHLGYGIHYAPNTNVNADALVTQLGFDWVKIYELANAGRFPGKKILLRIDMRWQDNWDQFKANLTAYMRAVATSPVDAVEIHNEPNLSHEWSGKPNAWQYTQILRVTYTVVKQVKPSLIVVSGGLAPTITTADRAAVDDLEFAREMFENGAGQWFDAFGYHPYGYNMPPEADPYGSQPLVFRRTERIRALMEEYGIYKQVWLTEFGWLRDPSEEGVGCSDSNPDFQGFAWMRVSGAQQGDYLVRAFEYAHLYWAWAGPMFVWNLNWQQQEGTPICSHMRWFALLRPNGEVTSAFRRLAAMRRYVSDYQPRIELRGDPVQGTLSLRCPARTEIGRFTVENIGYPANLIFDVAPINVGAPYLEVQPVRARAGEPITIYADPAGATTSGAYPVFINIRANYTGRPLSQSLSGTVNLWYSEENCP